MRSHKVCREKERRSPFNRRFFRCLKELKEDLLIGEFTSFVWLFI
jgi:hypothetical protein